MQADSGMDRARASRLYRWLLKAYPREFRDRFAVELEQIFEQRWRELGAAGGRRDRAAFLARAFMETAAAAAREWRQTRRRRVHRVGIIALDHRPSSHRRAAMLGTDIRHALRVFRRQRLATALAVLMLSLGIGATVIVFSLMNALYLRPFPFPEPDRLVYINERAPRWDLESTGINFPDFHQWRSDVRLFEGLALYSGASFNLADEQGAERVAGAAVTHDFTAVLGVSLLLGRMFSAEEDLPSGPSVVVISEATWRERFGGSPEVLGKVLRLNNQSHEIIGVLPRHAEFPQPAALWVPLAGDPNQEGLSYSYDGIGRLKPGVSVEDAEADLLRAHAPIWEQRDEERIVSPFVQPLREAFVRDYRAVTSALFAAVAMLLAVACANVAAVMLARAISRRREMGIRLAMGANGFRLLRQLLVENALLAACGGIAGLALGRWALQLLLASARDSVPPWTSFDFDGRTVAFSLIVTAAAALLFGWAPALHAAGRDLRAAINDAAGGATTSPRGRRTLSWLVAAEFAMAAVLIASSALLVRAFGELQRVDPGYSPEHVLTFSLNLPSVSYPDFPASIAFWDELIARLRAVPGVEAAGIVSCPPLTCHWGNFYRIEGRAPRGPDEPDPVVLSRIAGDGYFEALGIRLQAGRFFEARDGLPDTSGVVIVNDTFLRTFWPGATPADAIGRRLSFNGDDQPWLSVVGVTEDVKHYGLETPMRPGLYFPARQLSFRHGAMAVIVRTAGEPESLVPAARAIVGELDASLSLYRVATAESMLADSLRRRATYSWMLAVFAGLGLVLALGGTYGVTSYLVSQRKRELGIRVALGARPVHIARAVLRGSFAAICVGVALGLIATIAVAGWLGDLLFGISPDDPLALAAAAVALGLTAALANWLPARRATRTDPVASLKVD
jgi:putative ABC transport system permease protein